VTRDDRKVFRHAVLIALFVCFAAAALAGEPPRLPAGVTCEAVRAKVAEHGRYVAYAWARLQGYTTAEINEAQAMPALIWLFLFLASPALAQHPNHDASHFYSSWMMPDNRQVSCCHNEDCQPAQSRIINGRWQARHNDADDWADIPASKIETDRDSPDGRSHLCGRRSIAGFTVFCFLPASGS
jgi:hypothetical protein